MAAPLSRFAEQFSYRSGPPKRGRIPLYGTPGDSTEYRQILRIELNSDQMTVTAQTVDKIVRDLWKIVWNGRPILEYQKRLVGALPFDPPNEIHIQSGSSSLSASTYDDKTIIHLTRGGKRIDFPFGHSLKNPTSAAINERWAAVAFERGLIQIIGRSSVTTTSIRADYSPTKYMLLIGDELLAVDYWGIPRIWNLNRQPIYSQVLFPLFEENMPICLNEVCGSATEDGGFYFIGRGLDQKDIYIRLIPPESLSNGSAPPP